MAGFKYVVSGGVGYYIIDEFEKTLRVKTCFSTRVGGVSTGKFAHLNPGYKTKDDRQKIDENINILCRETGFKKDDLVLSDQIHGNRHRIVNRKDRGKGVVKESNIEGVDAFVTNEKDVAISVVTADCVPVFLFDGEKGVIGLCHAGWRGVINGIVPLTIEAMNKNYGTSPYNIMGALGPSIGPCCFKVGSDVAKEFENAFKGIEGIIIKEGGGQRVNLWRALEEQLKTSGVKEENIIVSELCTLCNPDKFYSYRRDGAQTGRMISILQLI